MPVHFTNQYGMLMAVYYSHDGGANWALTPMMIPNGGSMNFVSATDGFVWNGTDFYVTHDGAKTWTTVSPGVSFGDNFAGMDFVNTTTGFVLTNDVTHTVILYKTMDGGATWTRFARQRSVNEKILASRFEFSDSPRWRADCFRRRKRFRFRLRKLCRRFRQRLQSRR